MIISVNPEAEVSANFAAVKAGTYAVRIKSVEDRNPEKNDLKVQYEHVTPVSELCGLDGGQLKGVPSGLTDYIMLADDKQWKLRTLTEACGLPWENYDPTTELNGKEVEVVVKLEEYQGEQRNKIARYVIPK